MSLHDEERSDRPLCYLLDEHSIKELSSEDNPYTARPLDRIYLTPAVQRVDNTIHQINQYLLDSVVCFVNAYTLDSILYST